MRRSRSSLLFAAILFCVAEAPRGDLLDVRPAVHVQRVLNPVSDVSVYPNGQILADGRFHLATGDTSEFLTRFNPDGTVDLAFTQTVERLFDVRRRRPGVFAASVDRHGGVELAWAARNENQNLVFSDLARLTRAGLLDPSFGTNGAFGPGSQILWMRQAGGGRLLIGGRMNHRLGDEVGVIYRIEKNGAVDPTFRSDIPLDDDAVAQAAAILPDGRIVVGIGHRKRSLGASPEARETIALLSPTGKKSASFGRAVRPWNGHPVLAIAVQRDGKILAGGVGLLIRLDQTGRLDGSFARQTDRFSTGRSDPWAIRRIVPQDDGKILVGGDFQSYQGRPAGMLVRLNADGSLDELFQGNLGRGFSSDDIDHRGIFSIAVQTDGKILAAGTFVSLNGNDAPYLARLNPDGSRDPFPRLVLTGLAP